MLPSQGLFKDTPCPFYNNAKGDFNQLCARPYCHFKHLTIIDDANATAASTSNLCTQKTDAQYKPAPKLLSLPLPVTPAAVKKKKIIEYNPDKPEINCRKSKRSPSITKSISPPSSSTLSYVPATTVIDLEKDELNAAAYVPTPIESNLPNPSPEIDDLNDVFNDIDDIINTTRQEKNTSIIEISDSDSDAAENVKPKYNVNKHDKNDDIAEASNVTKKENRCKSPPCSLTIISDDDLSEPSVKEERRESIDGLKSPPCSSKPISNDDLLKPSVKEELQIKKSSKLSSSDKEKYKSKDTHGHHKHKSASSSSSSKHKSSSSSSSHGSSRDRHKHDSLRSHRKSSSKSTSSSKLSKSPTSSIKTEPPSSKQLDRKDDKNSKPKDANDQMSDVVDDNNELQDTLAVNLDELFPSTREDIMRECAMVYEELEKEFAAKKKENCDANAANVINGNVKDHGQNNAKELKRACSKDNDTDDECGTSTLKKKRVAYEKAADKYANTKPVSTERRPNPMQIARQSTYNRELTAQKEHAEKTAAAEAALKKAEESVRLANMELLKALEEKNATMKAETSTLSSASYSATLTPLIPKSHLMLPMLGRSPRSIAPVSNILAIERAKKKVEELKAQKQTSFTPAQSLKGLGRVAHTPTVGPLTSKKTEPEKQPKPPVLESNSTKISFNLRMQYYDKMVEHCIAMYPNIADAWERAQSEELAVFKKCNTPVIYKHSASLAINKLRKEAIDSGNSPSKITKLISHEVVLAGKQVSNHSWSVEKRTKSDTTLGGAIAEPFDKLTASKAYDVVYALRLTDDQLISNGFPRAGPKPGLAIIKWQKPQRRPNSTERYCSRCGTLFSLTMYEKNYVDECNYHPKSAGYTRGSAENQHRCCQQPAGTPGCTYGNYHVFDYVYTSNLTGYVTTIDRADDSVPTKKDIFALDCEMCYTTEGIELTRVTVVDINGRTVYDALVKPFNKIVDYNTTYSGITEQMLANETRSLRDVQAVLLSMFHSHTILVGHSLESDLKALKIIHSVVVDTSVLFPHKMGPPKKRALKTLCNENLKRIIQEHESGHDSAEDAEVCIQLIKFYLRNKIS